MHVIKKIGLSIPTIIGIGFMVINLFPSEFAWLTPSMEVYYIQFFMIWALSILQLSILILQLWSFKNLEKSQKWNWTFLLIVYAFVTTLIFIWKRHDELEKENKKKALLSHKS